MLLDDSQCLICAGNVKLGVYWWYLKAQGLLLCALFAIFFLVYQGLQIFASIWLSRMSNKDALNSEIQESLQESGLNPLNVSHWPEIDKLFEKTVRGRFDRYLLIYLGLGLAQAVFMFIYNVVFSVMAINACKFIHIQILGTLRFCPLLHTVSKSQCIH